MRTASIRYIFGLLSSTKWSKKS